MHHRNLAIERRQRRGHRRRGVALHDHAIRLGLLHRLIERGETARGQRSELLSGPHQGERDIHRDAEILQDLIQHFAVLSRRANDRLELSPDGPGLLDHGRQLDGLWTRTQGDEDS